VVHLFRVAEGLMSNLGLAEWVSQTDQEYEDKAIAFVQDIPESPR
jgi:predicted O-linked N-acetylglucosamine transferase (SPINDLY family)